jgi:hypothetical protein
MKFFLPYAEDKNEAERILGQICQNHRVAIPVRRIRRIEYVHDGKPLVAEVGKEVDESYGLSEQLVVAIVGGNPLMVCLPTRGVRTGTPIYVGKQDARKIEYFD